MRWCWLRRGLERGTSALELSLVLPVFMLLVIGTVDFGRATVLYNTMGLAARDGARAAQVLMRQGDTVLSAEDRAIAESAASVVASAVTGMGSAFSANTVAVQDASGYWYVTTRTEVTYEPLAGGFLRITSIPVSASSTLAAPCGKCAA